MSNKANFQAVGRAGSCALVRALGSALIFALLAGCSSQNRIGEPIVDLQSADPFQYDQDLSECRRFASEVAMGTRVGAGAVAGAVLGGVIGAAVGDSSIAAKGAGIGAANGSARGALSGARERSQVVKNCLRQRGYRVLN